MSELAGASFGEGGTDDDFTANHAAAGVVVQLERQHVGGTGPTKEFSVEKGHLPPGDDRQREIAQRRTEDAVSARQSAAKRGDALPRCRGEDGQMQGQRQPTLVMGGFTTGDAGVSELG